jgi:hypothetical protein
LDQFGFHVTADLIGKGEKKNVDEKSLFSSACGVNCDWRPHGWFCGTRKTMG